MVHVGRGSCPWRDAVITGTPLLKVWLLTIFAALGLVKGVYTNVPAVGPEHLLLRQPGLACQ
jgi:hypothetical protein